MSPVSRITNWYRRYLFLIPATVMVLSEMSKPFADWYMTGAWHRTLFQHGGLPSSHSAFVTSLLIVVGKKKKIDSVEFAIAFVFAAIVWYDAVAVRSEIGKQAEILNLIQELVVFSEAVGHSLIEVIAGIIFGAAVTLVGMKIVKGKR